MESEEYVFSIGKTTLAEMSHSTKILSDEAVNNMSAVIMNLKDSLDRYRKFSTIGFFGKMFTSKLEIKANITISLIQFEMNLEKGSNYQDRLQVQYESFKQLKNKASNIVSKFNDDLDQLDQLLATPNHGYDIQRIVNRRNDLVAAQLLMINTAAQYDLAITNINILIDKFDSIEQILKPLIEQNEQILK